MRVEDIYKKLDAISPFELQEPWDNSGLIVGNFSSEVDEVVLSLDIDEAMIEEAKEHTLFIVHHPLIFSKLSALDFQSYPANLIEKLILKKQSLIAMHTNFDQTHLNRYVLEEVLGLTLQSSQGFLAYASIDYESEAFYKTVANRLGLKQFKIVAAKTHFKRVALCTGSGASLIPEVEADVFLTGDIKYHDAIQAKSLNLAMMDIGHFESERYFSEVLAPLLQDWPISVIISSSKNPFVYN